MRLASRLSFTIYYLNKADLVLCILATDTPHAALALLRSLPSDLLPTCASSAASATAAIQLQIREHLDYITLFTCLDHHLRFAEVWARPPYPLEGKGKEKAESTAKAKLEMQNWKEGVQNLVEELWQKALEVLEGEWLKGEVIEGSQADEDGTGSSFSLTVLSENQTTNVATLTLGSRRMAELVTIRRLLIPDLVLRVHHSLVSTCTVLPSNLTRAFELATIVADERYGLYNEFIPFGGREGGEINLMKRYLEEVRLTSLKSLELGMGIVGIVAE